MNQTFYGCASITDSKRVQIINKQPVPGPGTYDPTKQDHERIPKWTLKPKIQYSSCFHNFKQYVPAPGCYETQLKDCPKKKKNKQSDLKITKYRDRNYVEKSSPIIALQIPSFIKQNTGYSFGYRNQIVTLETSPGPIYHVNQKQQEKRMKKMNCSSGFGYGNRYSKQNQDIPGPGNYSPSRQNIISAANKWTFGKSLRKDKPTSNNPTGPGEYNPKLYNTSRSFKLKGRYKQSKNQQSLACPGSYQIPDTKCKRAAVFKALTSGQRKQVKYDEPSPFSYDPINSTLKRNGFSLGQKLSTIDQNIQNPGPGSYQLSQKLDQKVGGYMSRKLQVKKKAIQDNFYKYNPNFQPINFKYPQYSFKQSNDVKPKISNNLGPGSYNINKNFLGWSYSMGKDRRFKQLNKQKSYGNLLSQKDYYSTVGYLPSYLKSKQKNSDSSKNKQGLKNFDTLGAQQKQN